MDIETIRAKVRCSACRGPIGRRLNVVEIRRRATWDYPCSGNVLTGEDHVATAFCCDAALREWRRIEFDAMTRGGRRARECLWMNYAEPTELHDYAYLGNEKRERERIARKVRTWAAGLQRLERLERQAIIAALR